MPVLKEGIFFFKKKTSVMCIFGKAQGEEHGSDIFWEAMQLFRPLSTSAANSLRPVAFGSEPTQSNVQLCMWKF